MQEDKKPEPEKPPANRVMGQAISLGYTMVAGMLLFTGLGWYADRRRGGGELFTILGMFMGLIYCGYEVWKLVRLRNGDQ